MSPARLVLCLTLLVPSLGFAQASEEWAPYTPPATETAPPPPLVPATPPLPPPPPPPPSRAPTEARPRGELIPRRLPGQQGESDRATLRLILTPWSGVIMGMGASLVGIIPSLFIALPFCVGSDLDEPRCGIPLATTLSVSYAVGVTLGISIVGRMTGGQGDGTVTFLGALAGTAVGAGIGVATGSTGGLILGLALAPVLLAVSAYELSHYLATHPSEMGLQARSRFQVMPVVGLTPRGGLLGGLGGRF